MELIGAILTASLVTATASHYVFIKPMLANLLLNKPNSFGAKNTFLVKVVSFVMSACTFPFMMFLLLSTNTGKTFYRHIEESFGEE